jgi:hypothetical protein
METQLSSIEWWLNVITATLEVLIVVELGVLALVAALRAIQLITGLYTKLNACVQPGRTRYRFTGRPPRFTEP